MTCLAFAAVRGGRFLEVHEHTHGVYLRQAITRMRRVFVRVAVKRGMRAAPKAGTSLTRDPEIERHR
jgi:hypothetical protein